MRRREQLDRRYRRVLWAGLLISAAAHAAVLGWRFGVPGSASGARLHAAAPAALDPRRDPRVERERLPMQVVRLREAATAAQPQAAPSAIAPAFRAVAVAPAAELAAPVAAPVVDDDAATLPEAPPLLDSQPAVTVDGSLAGVAEAKPKEDDQPAAGAVTASAVPVYAPGSVGRAKGAWIGEASSEGAGGRGHVSVGGGGHPCPGAGPAVRPPPLKSAALNCRTL